MILESVRPYARPVGAAILSVNGIGALIGGGLLMYNPSGKMLGLSTDLLAYSPFEDYFIPGFTLFICNGLLSIIGLWNLWKKEDNYGQWMTMQGLVLGVWILCQIIMIRKFFPPMHITFILMAFMLTIFGMALPVTRRSHRHRFE